MKFTHVIALALAITLGALTPGCITIPDMDSLVTDNQLVAQSAIQYSTLQYISNDPERAAAVLRLTSDLREAFTAQNELTSIALLVETVRSRIDFASLNSFEVVSVNMILSLSRSYIQQDIQEGRLDPAALTAPLLVVDWIEGAALLRAAGLSDQEILGSYRR